MKKIILSLLLLTPLAATAADDICTKLIPDITNNYYLYNLEVMRNGNPQVSQELVSCTYRAVRKDVYGDLPVVVTVLLNTTNNRFTVEVR